MSKQKSPQEERTIIVGHPDKRPYGVRVRIHLQTSGALGYIEEACVSLNSGAFLSFAPARAAPWEGGKKYVITLEGFATAAAAESAGRRLVQALLWMAVSTDAPLRLEYLSYEPAAVFERNRSTGMTCEAYADTGFSPQIVLGELQDAYALFPEPDGKLLLSMEIFCSARLDLSQRTVFLTVVSALEPLAQEAPLGEGVTDFVSDCVAKLKSVNTISADIKESLAGRLRQLRQESIRQALKRLAREILPNQPEAADLVDDAYALRSQLIHTGVPADLDIDLERESRVVSRVIRDMYASILNRKLARAG